MGDFKWVLWLILLLLAGCSSIGPHQISIDRGRYNDVVQNTNNQQTLKNIVAIRYVEPPSFIKITGITSSYTLEKSSSGQTGTSVGMVLANSAPTTMNNLNLNPYLTFTDSPTITYIPIDDAETASDMLNPVKIKYLSLFYFGGIHETKLLLKLTLQSINDFYNAAPASNMKPIAPPIYKKFYTFLDILENMIRVYEADVDPIKLGKIHALKIKLQHPQSPQARELKSIFGIPQNYDSIIFTDEEIKHPAANIIQVMTRTMYGILTFLSYSVQVPESDIKAHHVYIYRLPNGQPYDWKRLLKGIMNIASSDREPENAFVKVYTHNHWFYISNSDLDSKVTFALVTRLLTLIAGENRNETPNPNPTLTVNVNDDANRARKPPGYGI